MSEHYPRVRVHDSHGALIIRDGLRLCFYMRRSNREIAQEVMRSLEAYLHAIGTETLACSVGFWLPTEFLEDHGPGSVRELALELASLLPFDSGHAGLFFNSILGYRETEEALSRLCLRYPGMDIGEVESTATRLDGRVNGPAWLTFLGQPVLGELGGLEGLRARLSSPTTTVEPLPGDRAVISLGPWPEAGDTDAGRNLPEYRELARVLGPHLYRPSTPWSPYFPKDIFQRWERRFLD